MDPNAQPGQAPQGQAPAGQNPFMAQIEAFKQKYAQQAQQPQAPQGGMPAGMPAPGSVQPGVQPGMGPDGQPAENQMNPGQNPGNTKFLMGAINSLDSYIKQSTDKDEIATARSVIALLSRLIEKDQTTMSAQLG